MKRVVTAGLVFVFAGVCAWAQHSRVDGCLAVKNGQYVLLQGGSTQYALHGNNQELQRHLGELVRVDGQVFRGSQDSGGLRVTSISTLQSNCLLTPPPGSATSAVVGKSGNQQVAVPDTTTGTAGKVTPGYQTEAGVAQAPGTNTMPRTPARAPLPHSQPGAPPIWEQAGQNPNSADVMAEAAARGEVQPGAPLGTKPDAPESAGEQPQNPPRTEAATQQDRTVVIRGGSCMPDKISIRPGEAVQWINYSEQTVHVASTSMQAATGVEGTGAFSSDVGPGKIFRQVFDRPGTYEYTCSAGKRQASKARIVVQTE